MFSNYKLTPGTESEILKLHFTNDFDRQKQPGRTRQYNGVDQSTDLGAAGVLPALSDFTLFGFGYLSDLTNNPVLFSQYELSTDGRLLVYVRSVVSKVSLFIGHGSGDVSLDSTYGTTDEWFLWLVRRIGPNIELWINNQLHASVATSISILQTGNLLGARSNSAGTYNATKAAFMNGRQFGVHCFDRALKEPEMTRFHTQFVKPERRLVVPLANHRWFLDEAEPSRIAFDSGTDADQHGIDQNYATSMNHVGSDAPWSSANLEGFDQAYIGNGIDSFQSINVGNEIDFGTGGFEVSFNVIPTPDDLTDFKILVRKIDDHPTTRPGWQIYFNDAGNIRMNLGANISSLSSRTWRDCSLTMQAGKQYEVRVVWDGANIDFYVDGVLSNGDYGDQNGAGNNTNNNGNLIIGADPDNDRWYFGGLISDVLIAGEEYGTPTHKVPLDLLIHFDENGQYDSNAKRGSVARYVELKGSPCLSLNGVDQYVTLNSDLFAGLASFKFSGWVKFDSANARSKAIIGSWAGNSNMSAIIFTITTGELRSRVRTESTADPSDDAIGSISLYDDQWHFIEVEFDGTTITQKIDGVVDGVGTFPTANILPCSDPTNVGRYDNDALTIPDASFAGFEIEGIIDLPFSEGGGGFVHDRNENQYQIVNYVSSVWSVVQDNVHSSVSKGHTPYIIIGNNAADFLELINNQSLLSTSQNFTTYFDGIFRTLDNSYAILWAADHTSFTPPYYNYNVRFRDTGVVEAYFDLHTQNIIANHGLSDGDPYQIEVHFEYGLQWIKLNGNTLVTGNLETNITYGSAPIWIGKSVLSSGTSSVMLHSVRYVDHEANDAELLHLGGVDFKVDQSGNGHNATYNGNVEVCEKPAISPKVPARYLNSLKTNLDFEPEENAPDFRRFSLPGDGIVPDYSFNGSPGDLQIGIDNPLLESNFYLIQ